MAVNSFDLQYLLNPNSRKVIRTLVLVLYFLLFQALILLQKPFLQVEFIYSFYFAFAGIFGHHLYLHYFDIDSTDFGKNIRASHKKIRPAAGLSSYAIDFAILILFMKSFPQLSSFLLVIQLFLLFIASFDLEFIQLCGLGLMASFGISLMNLSLVQAGSMQHILSLVLFNLSYLAVIIVSGQLKFEIAGIQKDLTLVQKKSKSQAEFSKVLLEKIPLGLIVSEKSGQILLQNSFVEENLKLDTVEVGQLLEQTRNQQAAAEINFFQHASLEKRILQVDKVHYFDHEANDELAISLFRDVTDMRRLEDQLKQKEKLAAIGQLAAGIAHEIRNPLAGISGSVQLLSSEALDGDQLKLMKIILKEIDRLNNLITEFLDYSKPEKKPDQTVELSIIMEEVIQNIKLSPIFPAGLEWNIRLHPQKILGFADKLKQAFLNIVINAIQAMDGLPTQKIEINLSNDKGMASVSIKDHGQGMKPETKKRLFEPFHTTKIKGTGLGLAVTHKILDSHGAQIDVVSEIGKGTEFIIKFPSLGY